MADIPLVSISYNPSDRSLVATRGKASKGDSFIRKQIDKAINGGTTPVKTEGKEKAKAEEEESVEDAAADAAAPQTQELPASEFGRIGSDMLKQIAGLEWK